MTEQLHSMKSVANRISLSVREVYRLIAKGELPKPVKVGRASRLFESDIQTYLERLKANRN
ncbi:helix-turn-helix domain-containing protein [Coraliomargarita sp. SDUM461004]|uniref:Helix-turn-helix domain-containing protein n=2 Tax=Thalassobacterium sedimentorum TaxID=3041258 RepID=A0ABU1AJN6_9BACT|nr:helix-turn-helix domain-containing protein [Coraliomargarita sp. SDUM461004]